MADYALRFRSQSLVQRLGYLADLLQLPLEAPIRDQLLASIERNTCYLGRPSRWETGGDYDATWHVVDNLPRQELLSEIEVL
jgi:predicted transcriptional regulator of viral defense system